MEQQSPTAVDVLSIGEVLVDLVAETAGAVEEVERFSRQPGGTPANVAVGVVRCGGRAALAGAVGEDPLGRFLRARLGKEGVDVSALKAVPARTGVVFVTRDGEGRPAYFSPNAPAAELDWTVEDADALALGRAAVVHFGSRLLLGAGSTHALLRVAARAREAKRFVAFDPNVHLHLWSDRPALRRTAGALLPGTDLVKLARGECEPLTGHADPAGAAQALVEAGARLAVVTLAEEGCLYARREGGKATVRWLGARRVRAVDAAGAGDGFMAVLLTGAARRLSAGEDPVDLDTARLERLLGLATEAGTRACFITGAMAGMSGAPGPIGLDV